MILNSPIHLHTRPTSCHSMVSSNCVVPRANYTVAEIAGVGNYMYKEVKTAILQRYNINKETYRQRLRSIRPKKEETHQELAIRVHNLTWKWAKDCKKVEDVLELIATEQLLEALPTNIRIWVRERKPKTGTEAG